MQKGRAKLVTAAGVFFHLEELHSVTEGIAALIRDGGVFCVQAISLAGMLRYTQFDQVYHEHLTYWTVHSLDRLFSEYGLEIFHADMLPIHGGSMELLVGGKGRADNRCLREKPGPLKKSGLVPTKRSRRTGPLPSAFAHQDELPRRGIVIKPEKKKQ